ncbi:MAG: hypothetical protein ACMXYA_02140 [Candidatus Woesearchaeota archaeon]
MRIGILGKGGSGKSTIAATLIEYFAKTHTVFAVDADQNSHLDTLLAIDKPISLSEQSTEIKNYLRGKRTDIGDQPLIATTPPSLKSHFIRLHKDDMFLKKFATQKDNIFFVRGGTYEHEDVGVTCYHGKLETTEMMYHHLLDTESDIVIADSTAGLDSLGHSMFFVHDCIFYIVEPTKKSIGVYLEFEEIARKYNAQVYVIANKIESQQDIDFLTKHIPTQNIIAQFAYSSDIKKFEQGESECFTHFQQKHKSECQKVADCVFHIPKNWDSYYKNLLDLHKKSAESWYDAYYNAPISTQIDPSFSYKKVL